MKKCISLKGHCQLKKSHFYWKICYLLLLQTTPMITVTEGWDKNLPLLFGVLPLGPIQIPSTSVDDAPLLVRSSRSGPVHICLYIVYGWFHYFACSLFSYCFCGFSHSKRGKNIFFQIGRVVVKLWRCQRDPRDTCTRNTTFRFFKDKTWPSKNLEMQSGQL